MGRRKGKDQKAAAKVPALPAYEDEDEAELSDEDMAFVKSEAGRLGFLKSLDRRALDKSITQPKAAKPPLPRPKDPRDEISDDESGDEDEMGSGSDGEGSDDVAVTDDEDDGMEDSDEEEEEEEERGAGRPAAAAPPAKGAAPAAQPAAGKKGGEVGNKRPRPEGLADDHEDEDGPAGRSAADAVGRYERLPRSGFRGEEKEEAAPLPVKSLQGQVVYDADGQRLTSRQLALDKIKVKGVRVVEDLRLNKELEERRAEEEAAEAARRGGAAAAGPGAEEEEGMGAEEAAEAPQQRTAQDGRLDAARGLLNKEIRRQKLLEEIAVACDKILLSPEDNYPDLKGVLQLCGDADGHVARLAMLSAVQVFRNVCPGYRIRQLSDEEMSVKVSKEVKRVRNFEMGLLAHYQAFLKTLRDRVRAHIARSDSASARARAELDRRTAAKAMCVLLRSLPHFNYRSDLLANVVGLMPSRDLEVRAMCCETVRGIVEEDEDMEVAVEAAQLIGDIIRGSLKPMTKDLSRLRTPGAEAKVTGPAAARIQKAASRAIPPEVISALESLRFSELPIGGPDEDGGKDDKKGKGKDKGKGKAQATPGRKKPTSKEIDKELERDMAEAEATISTEERRRRQSKALEHAFEVYFRVLKTCAAGAPPPAKASEERDPEGPSCVGAVVEPVVGAAKVVGPPVWVLRLLPPTLQGLARLSPYMGLEYFQDLVDLLLRVLHMPGLTVSDQVQTLLAVSDILARQMDALRLDREGMYSEMLSASTRGPLEPLNEKLDDLLDGGGAISKSSSSVEYGASISQELTRLEHAILCGPRGADPQRLAAGIKAALSASLHSRVPRAMGALGIAYHLLRRHGRLRGMLEGEGVEGGGPAPAHAIGGKYRYAPEMCTPGSAMWELSLLASHYHPDVAAQARHVAVLSPGSGTVPQGISARLPAPNLGPVDLAGEYKVVETGEFRPGPAKPREGSSGKGGHRGKFRGGASASKPLTAAFVGAAEGEVIEGPELEKGEEEELAGPLTEHFVSVRRVEDNTRLRREVRALQRAVGKFQEHLKEKAAERAAAEKAAAAGGKGKGKGAAAAATPASGGKGKAPANGAKGTPASAKAGAEGRKERAAASAGPGSKGQGSGEKRRKPSL